MVRSTKTLHYENSMLIYSLGTKGTHAGNLVLMVGCTYIPKHYIQTVHYIADYLGTKGTLVT